MPLYRFDVSFGQTDVVALLIFNMFIKALSILSLLGLQLHFYDAIDLRGAYPLHHLVKKLVWMHFDLIKSVIGLLCFQLGAMTWIIYYVQCFGK